MKQNQSHKFCVAPMMERFAPENDCGIGVSTRSDSVMLYQMPYRGTGPLIAVYPQFRQRRRKH
jgi:hypothetical protein